MHELQNSPLQQDRGRGHLISSLEMEILWNGTGICSVRMAYATHEGCAQQLDTEAEDRELARHHQSRDRRLKLSSNYPGQL